MYSSERAHRISAQVDTVCDLARAVRAEFWPKKSRPPAYYVSTFTERLITHVFQADGERAAAELTFLQAYFGDGIDLRDVDDFIRNTANAFPDLPLIVPEFLQAARAQDAALGTDIAASMVAEITALLEALIDVDGRSTGEERVLADAVIATLRAPREG